MPNTGRVIATRSGQPAYARFKGRRLTSHQTTREWLEERRKAANRHFLLRLFRRG